MFTAGKNYRSVLDYDGIITIDRRDWNSTFNSLGNIICALRELIHINLSKMVIKSAKASSTVYFVSSYLVCVRVSAFVKIA